MKKNDHNSLKKLQTLLDVLNKNQRGLTIQNMMNITEYARNTVKTYLNLLVWSNQVEERIYGHNVKVYFAEVKKLRLPKHLQMMIK